ncbi:hypothetical protein TcCL_Unassigned01787 [Trypanosoma cruzi]|nr:hypothetical protein TcCL_Unassigned01787 [Trypanosoma cruzi]
MKTTLPAVDLLKEPQLLGLLHPLTSVILKIPCWTRTALEEKEGVPVQWCCHKQQDYERRRGHQRNWLPEEMQPEKKQRGKTERRSRWLQRKCKQPSKIVQQKQQQREKNPREKKKEKT